MRVLLAVLLFPALVASALMQNPAESSSKTLVDQFPDSVFLSSGVPMIIKCKASTDTDDTAWYHQPKPVEQPKLLIYYADNHFPIIPDTVSGAGYSKNFTFTIQNTQSKHAGYYFCQQDIPNVFGAGAILEIKQRTNSSPTVSIFPPSKEQLRKKLATNVCFIKGIYPLNLTEMWKAEGNTINDGVKKSEKMSDTDFKYSQIRILNLMLNDWKDYEKYSCDRL